MVLACAEASGLGTLDLFDTIGMAVTALGHAEAFRTSHPGPVIHRLTALQINRMLARRHMPSR